MYSVTIVESINEIEKEKWEALATHNIYTSYGWLKTVEETYIGLIHPRYVLVWNSTELIGGAICTIFSKADNVLTLDSLFFGRLKKVANKIGISFLPTFTCCPLQGSGDHFIIKKEMEVKERERVMERLLDAVETYASDHKLSVFFHNVLCNEVSFMQLLHKRDYIRTYDRPMSYLDPEWSSLSEYKAYITRTVSRNMKKCIAREINKNRKAGVTIQELEKPEEYEERCYELFTNNYWKYNRLPFPFKKEFLKKLKENLGKEVTIYGAFKKGTLIAVNTLLARNKIASLPSIGVDHRTAVNDFTYFNMTFYRPIIDCYAKGIRRLYLGNAMYTLKMRRGCKTAGTYIFYKPYYKTTAIAVKPWFLLHSFWMLRKLDPPIRNNIDFSINDIP